MNGLRDFEGGICVEGPAGCISPSSRRRPNILPDDSRVEAIGFWGRAVSRNSDTPGTGSIVCLAGRTPRKLRSSRRSCTGPETSERSFPCSSAWPHDAWTLLAFFHHHRNALLSFVRLQDFLAQAQGFRSDFDELIIRDELDRLLEIQLAERNQADRLIGRGSAHVGEFFLAHNIDIEIGVLRILADDHPFVDFHSRTSEQFAALLQVVQRVRGSYSRAIGHQGAGWAMRNFALPLRVAVEEGIHHDRSASVGKQLAAEADQPAAGYPELDAHASVAVV